MRRRSFLKAVSLTPLWLLMPRVATSEEVVTPQEATDENLSKFDRAWMERYMSTFRKTFGSLLPGRTR